MADNANIAQQLENIKIAIENSGSNSLIAVWIPITVVFIGAFIAHVFSLIEKKRQRETLRYTIALWLRESIQSIDGFIHSIQRFIDDSKSSPVWESKRLFCPMLHLECIKEFPIDKMSDALVARLKVSKKEKTELAKNFYDLYDFTSNFTASQAKILEAHTDYHKKMNSLSQKWDEQFAEFSYLTKDYLLSIDATDLEREFFNKAQILILEMRDQIATGGLFRRDILQDFIQKMSDAFNTTPSTQRIIEANKRFNRVRVVLHNMESLQSDTIQVLQTQCGLLSSSKEYLAVIVSFYEQHKIKGVFSFSNKLS